MRLNNVLQVFLGSLERVAQKLRNQTNLAAGIATAMASEERGGRPGRRVLLVEDEVLVSMTTSDLLSEMGYEVAVAETGADALRALEREVDVLITDLGLPDMDGAALIAAARARQSGLAVVVASGRARQESHIKGRVVWLQKPYGSEDLRQALTQAVSTSA